MLHWLKKRLFEPSTYVGAGMALFGATQFFGGGAANTVQTAGEALINSGASDPISAAIAILGALAVVKGDPGNKD